MIGQHCPFPGFTSFLVLSVGLRGRIERKRAGRPRWGLGPLLAAIALSLQIIAVPTLHWHWPGPLGSVNNSGDLSAAFDEHALCLSGDRDPADDPTDEAPKKPVHHNFALCCFWHGNTALVLAPGAKLELVAFIRSRSFFAPATQVPARRLTGALGARAPPAQA
jgi:hypothetical protein